MRSMIMTLALVGLAFADEDSLKTLFPLNANTDPYVGISLQPTTLKSQGELLIGIEGGALINDHLLFGLSLNHTANELDVALPKTSKGPSSGLQDSLVGLSFSSLGLKLGWDFMSNNPVHLLAEALVGSAWIKYNPMNRYIYVGSGYYYNTESDILFMIRPELTLVLNFADYFCVTVGGGYRVVWGVHLEGLNNRDISGITGSLNLVFGRY